jgi:hypothetical protein
MGFLGKVLVTLQCYSFLQLVSMDWPFTAAAVPTHLLTSPNTRQSCVHYLPAVPRHCSRVDSLARSFGTHTHTHCLAIIRIRNSVAGVNRFYHSLNTFLSTTNSHVSSRCTGDQMAAEDSGLFSSPPDTASVFPEGQMTSSTSPSQ